MKLHHQLKYLHFKLEEWMASSGENGPKGYTRLDIKDKKLTEIRDDELIN